MTQPRVLVLNGGSSSGKSTLTLALQRELPGIWLRFSVDTLVDASPPALLSPEGLDLADDGSVHVAAAFSAVEDQWLAGIARMAESGARILYEDAFVSGPSTQRRVRVALGDVPTGWIGVRCDPAVAAQRERARGDRNTGMAALQADAVHRGIDYDLEVDTGTSTTDALVDAVRARWFR